MKSTNSIYHVINRELYYQWHSKKILIVFSILIILCGFHLYGVHNNIINNYNNYLKTEQSYNEEGINIIDSLKEKNNIYIDGNTVTEDNPLKQDFIELAISINNLEPQNIISNTLEYILFVFCTVLFGIYSSYIATYDFKYKQYKNLSVNVEQYKIILGKILSVIIVMLTTLSVSLVITFFGSFSVKSIVANKVPIEQYTISTFNYDNGLFLQLILVFFILLFYIILGFFIGFILKSMVIPATSLLIYGFIMPVLGKYDYRNIFSYFSNKVFSFKARFVIFAPQSINEVLGITIVVMTQIILLAILLFITKRRSAYT